LSPLYRQIVKQICPVMHCRYIKWKTHFVKTAQQITQYFFAVRVKKVKKEKEFDVKYILKAFIYILCQNCILKWGVTGFSWTMLLRMSELFNLPIYIRIRKFKKQCVLISTVFLLKTLLLMQNETLNVFLHFLVQIYLPWACWCTIDFIMKKIVK